MADITDLQLAIVTETGRVSLHARDARTHRHHLVASVGVLRQRLGKLVEARGLSEPDPRKVPGYDEDPADVPALALDLAHWAGQIAWDDTSPRTLRAFASVLDELDQALGA